jgi:DNA-directed RNA polymerase subunit L
MEDPPMEIQFLSESPIEKYYKKIDPNFPRTRSGHWIDGVNNECLRLSNCGVPFSNTLRRVLLEGVKVYAFKTSTDLDKYSQRDEEHRLYMLDAFYSKFRQYKDGGLPFDDDQKRDEFKHKSGYAKVLVNTGIEHNQVLADKLGFIPVNSQKNYVVIDEDDEGVKRIPLTDLIFFVGKSDTEPVENHQQSDLMNITVFQHLRCYYEEDSKLHDLTDVVLPPKDDRDKSVYELPNGESSVLFSCNSLITKLKPGQKLHCVMRLSLDCALNGARHTPCAVKFKFETETDAPATPDYDGNDMQRQFILSENTTSRLLYGYEPKNVLLTLQTFYRVPVRRVVYRGLNEIINMMQEFNNNSYLLLSDEVGDDQPIQVEDFQSGVLKLRINGHSHTLGNLLVDQMLRVLVELTESDVFFKDRDGGDDGDGGDEDKVKDVITNTVIAYKIIHPLRNYIFLTIKLPDGYSLKHGYLNKYFYDYMIDNLPYINHLGVIHGAISRIIAQISGMIGTKGKDDNGYYEQKYQERHPEGNGLLTIPKGSGEITDSVKSDDTKSLKYIIHRFLGRYLEIEEFAWVGEIPDGFNLSSVSYNKRDSLTDCKDDELIFYNIPYSSQDNMEIHDRNIELFKQIKELKDNSESKMLAIVFNFQPINIEEASHSDNDYRTKLPPDYRLPGDMWFPCYQNSRMTWIYTERDMVSREIEFDLQTYNQRLTYHNYIKRPYYMMFNGRSWDEFLSEQAEYYFNGNTQTSSRHFKK